MARPHTILALCLLGLLALAAVLRFWYAADLPLNGDEVGVGVLQASGQATTYTERLSRGITSLRHTRGFVAYDPAFSTRDVLRSLRFAGMHPPLYYVILHYLIRFLGNDVLTLRAFSIALSLASILALHGLGRALHGRTVGIAAAGLLAVAPYGVVYGSLVRPYPLAMLLALVSTMVAVHLARGTDLSLTRPALLLYLALSILGLYTIYQFAFILVLQFAYLALTQLNHRRNLLVLAAHAGLIGVSYLPWLPYLWTHLSVVTSRQYYFHQQLDLWRFGRDLVVLNSGVLFSAQAALATAVIGLPFYSALILGVRALWSTPTWRPFIVAVGVYLGVYIGVERLFHMSTLAEPKFLFFIVPVSFLIASVGVVHAFTRPTLRVIAMVAGFILLLANSALTCAYRDRLDAVAEESYVRDFAPALIDDRQEKLLLINTRQRRYLFPLVHALHTSGDVYILKDTGDGVEMPDENALHRYHKLYLANLYVDYEPGTFLPVERLDMVAKILRLRNFHLVRSITSGRGAYKHSLLVFARATP